MSMIDAEALRLIRVAAKEYDGSEYRFYQGGFFKYKIEGPSVFIGDIYIEPEFRGGPVAHIILGSIQSFLESTGCHFVYGYVMKGSTNYQKRIDAFSKWGLDVTEENDFYSMVSCLIKNLKGKT